MSIIATQPVRSGHSETLWAALRRSPAALAGSVIVLLMLAMALSAGYFFPGDPSDMVAEPLLWPGSDPAYPLGTDSLGRNVAAGIAYGARASLLIALSGTLLSVVIGGTVGALAGYHGARLGDVLMRITEVFQTVPSFLLVIVIVAIGNPTVNIIALAIGFRRGRLSLACSALSFAPCAKRISSLRRAARASVPRPSSCAKYCPMHWRH